MHKLGTVAQPCNDVLNFYLQNSPNFAFKTIFGQTLERKKNNEYQPAVLVIKLPTFWRHRYKIQTFY